MSSSTHIWHTTATFPRLQHHACPNSARLTALKPVLIILSLVVSKLLYCSTVWANTSASNIKKLQAVQNYACRTITNTRKIDHITPALHDLKWLPIDLLLLYRETVMTFKCINDLAPPYVCSKLKKRPAIHHQSTRNSDTLNIPLFRTTSGQRSFSYRGAKIGTTWITNSGKSHRCIILKEGWNPTYSKSIMDHSILARHKIDHFGFLYSIYFIKIFL